MGGATPNEWRSLTPSAFTWNITRFGWRFPPGAPTPIPIWFDALKIDDVEVWAYAEDVSSIAAYGLRMIPLSRTDIKSQIALPRSRRYRIRKSERPRVQAHIDMHFPAKHTLCWLLG